MPLLYPDDPVSKKFVRFNRWLILGLSVIGIAVGIWEAISCAEIRFGYVAAYAFAGAWILAIALCVVGLIALIYWRTRWVGAGLIAAGVLSCAMFYAGLAVLIRLDRVAWKHEPPLQRFGPEVKASLVIYFQRGITDDEVERFRSSILDHGQGSGSAVVHSYLRLLPSQANDHEGIALTFSDDAESGKISELEDKIRHDPRVENVYRNVAPSEIKVHPKPSVEPAKVR